MVDGEWVRPMAHEDLTRRILACSMAVMNELGAGFLEAVYEGALKCVLDQEGLVYESQKPLPVLFRGLIVGVYFPDLIVEGVVVVELKVAKALAPEHQAQVINYLRATGLEVGLLINFGNPRLEFRRLVRDPAKEIVVTGE